MVRTAHPTVFGFGDSAKAQDSEDCRVAIAARDGEQVRAQ